MDIFDSICDYLEEHGLHRSAFKLRQQLKQYTPSLNNRDANQKLLNAITKSNEDNAPASGIAPENEDIMENLMSRVISSPMVKNFAENFKGMDSLLNLHAFHKMVKCAEQLFFENESEQDSSSVVEKSNEDFDNLPHFGGGMKISNHSIQSDDVRRSNSHSRVLIDDAEDEYEDDDDPGFEMYECDEADVSIVSQQLALKYNFPERATCPKKGPAPPPKPKPTGGSLLPKSVKFPQSEDKLYPLESENVTYDCFQLKVVFDRERTGFEETKDYPIVVDNIIAGRYQIMEYLGSAAFSKALQCLDLVTKELVCVKIIENNKDYVDQSLDEIKVLRLINHNADPDDRCFLKVFDWFYHKEHLFIVTELLRDNLYEFSKYNREQESELYFTVGRLQKATYQILKALEYIHSMHLIHCDLKPENILIKSYSRCEVKVIDFGSSCFTHDHLSSYVQSRSYRAPEVILGCKYDQRIDMWSLGCILAELWTGSVLFQNDTVQGLLARVMGIIGPFPEDMFKSGRLIHHFFTKEKLLYQLSDEEDSSRQSSRKVLILVPKKSNLKARLRTDDLQFLDFVARLLEIDKDLRPTATEALQHPWIKECKYPDGL